ncbi:MAG TPA: hypothetical protein PLL75_01170 [Candidatus Omnitrophota bacterium]|nr:hypothetical protein [Candidatus Omnitrophota bacterium]HPS36324.1 hypothetical protein [Candidatus Omnitrophota bacterium]
MKKITLGFICFFLVSILAWGCSRTLQEKKATATDPGSVTELKFTGSKLKVVHDF